MKRNFCYLLLGLFFLVLAVVAGTGCRARKPTVITRDSIIEKTVISYRDTVIRDTIPGKMVRVMIPFGTSPFDFAQGDTLVRVTPRQTKSNGHVHLSYSTTDKGVEVECAADSLFRVNKAQIQLINHLRKQVSEHQNVKVVTKVPWWAWMIMGVGGFFTCLFIIRIAINYSA